MSKEQFINSMSTHVTADSIAGMCFTKLLINGVEYEGRIAELDVVRGTVTTYHPKNPEGFAAFFEYEGTTYRMTDYSLDEVVSENVYRPVRIFADDAINGGGAN